jgi:CDP-4-dehydro-6-deoxyglucose reductase
MSFSVRLMPSELSFSVNEGQTIHAAATAAGIGLPYSCKKGVCRTCRARVTEGKVLHKHSSLSAEDLAAGYALLCQSVPVTDVVVEAKPLPVVAKSDVAKALVADMRLAAPDVMIVSLRLPPRKGLQFNGGQYVDILLPDGARRSYSLASAARAEGNWELELHIRHSPGGRFSDHVFSDMKARELLTICGPLGTFFLREDSDKPIILVASGTGYAPIRSMLQYAFEAMPNRDIHLYWGGRTRADLYLADEPTQWDAQHERFHFIPVLSDPAPQDAWQGRTGFVHQAVIADYPDLSSMQVYACGAPIMVNSARRDFVEMCGLPGDEFFADLFLTQADFVENESVAAS